MGVLLLRALIALGVTTVIAVLAPPVVQAQVGLVPGTELNIGAHGCSLGFIATNDNGDRLAVTAGHCADEPDQRVYSHDGTLIGTVAHLTPDDFDNRSYGVTLILLSRNTYTQDAYFTKFGNPEVGDYVKKYGIRTNKTEGTITSIATNPDYPWRSRMESTLVGLPGDSGAAWVGNSDAGPKLLGLNLGFTTRPDGGYGFALALPIRSLIALVKRNSPKFGQGFIPVGP
ncbi:hypothetical protein ACXPWS_05135 [Mycobacterium sp. BMJ-28]